ncbi:MAG: glycerophosphodiester phosphodiesterase, partial [Acidobacteria bacterium]|nr:glycerophosphodiester phosphodiesterase [Acidobacteriota bacterium]
VLDLAQSLTRTLGRPVGVYPETKHPTYFRGIGLPLEEALVASLEKHAMNTHDAPVFIQSFESGNLRALRPKTRVRLVQLVDLPSKLRLDDEGLAEIAAYADGLGPIKTLIVPAKTDGTLEAPTDLVARAHKAGLFVHVWTMRADPQFLSPSYNGRPEAEFEQFRDLGVDGIFTDFPDIAVRALRTR